MSPAEKAIRAIEAAKRRSGQYPDCVVITVYDEETFAAFHPDGDFREHQRQRAAVCAWCREHGIRVDDYEVEPDADASQAGRATAAVQSRPFWRLGMSIGAKSGGPLAKTDRSGIGWAAIRLAGRTRSGVG